MVARLALIKELASIVPQEVLVVTSIGNNSYFWAELTDRKQRCFIPRSACALPRRSGWRWLCRGAKCSRWIPTEICS